MLDLILRTWRTWAKLQEFPVIIVMGSAITFELICDLH